MRHNDPRTYEEKLARGQAVGATPWTKIGANTAVGGTSETIWTFGGEYVYPAAGIQMQVVSTSANDAAAGSGVQQVEFYYLTTAFVQASEIVTMNGIGAVNTAALNIFRVLSFRAYRVGVTIPAAAAGTINLQSVGGGTTYSQIAAGNTRARNITYTVPTGKVLYIESVVVGTGASAATKVVLFTTRATYDVPNQRVLPPNFFMPFSELLVMDASFSRPLDTPTRFPTGVDLKVSAVNLGAGDATCNCALRGYLLNTNV